MDQLREELLGLVDLHRTQDADECLALWRRGIASLGRLSSRRPVPLEGLDPRALEASTERALEMGLVDDLSWLSSSASALFNLMISLPPGQAKRQLGRRILRTMQQCDAPTFVALATCLAKATPKVLASSQARARVALCLQLPYGLLPEVDSLALALISSPKMARDWLVEPSSGSLPERQLAARLLERAAREAWRQHQQGNRVGLRVFRSDAVVDAWQRLLNDRESLTWRHVAAARGVLVDLIPAYDQEVQSDLQEESSQGRYRRALISLVASIAVRERDALVRCRALLASDLLRKAPDIASTMLFGAVSAAAFEPELTEELLFDIAALGDLEVVSHLLAIRREAIAPDFATRALASRSEDIRTQLTSADEGIAALAGALLAEMDPAEKQATLPAMVFRAMHAYADKGPAGAREPTDDAIEFAEHLLGELEATGEQTAGERRLAYRALRELDRGLLESDALSDLLRMTQQRQTESEHSLDRLRARLTAWLLSYEAQAIESEAVPHLSWRLARLKALIHLVDADASDHADQDALRARRSEVVAVFRERVVHDHPSRLRRMVVVALARACDASLREDIFELSDLLLGIVPIFAELDDLEIFAQASLIADLEVTSRSYRALLESADMGALAQGLDKHEALISSFPWAGSPRVEALRAALIELGSALRRIQLASCVADLYSSNSSGAIAELAGACQWLAQLTSGARRRLEIADQEVAPFLGKALRTLDMNLREQLSIVNELDGCIALSDEELPGAFASLLRCGLQHLQGLPYERPKLAAPVQVVGEDHQRRLPVGLPAQRNIAGYHILDAIGDGGAGSVFIVCRYEDRNQVDAPLYALKRPAYSGQHAQVLSENEFYALFRQEAGTLLSLPPHKNLAAFVTFDLLAKPAPILVMEYIQGPHLGRLLESRELQCHEVFEWLEGIAAGLEAMHKLEIGHLDIKPENIVVREGAPVLVDFGLAGRQYRPGCATVYYGAPEVLVGEGRGSALPADVYSFACLAFEMLAGHSLFDGESLKDFVRAHLSHDGNPDALVRLSKSDPSLLPLTQVLARGLRSEPSQRTSVGKMRSDLAALAGKLSERPWPLGQ